MPALNQIDIIPGPVWLPQVEKPQERSPPFSDIREAIRQVIWIKGQCVHDPYKAKQRQPQLQPVYTRSADTAVSGWPKNFIFFIPLVWRIICTQPWPQCPALLDKRACPLAYLPANCCTSSALTHHFVEYMCPSQISRRASIRNGCQTGGALDVETVMRKSPRVRVITVSIPVSKAAWIVFKSLLLSSRQIPPTGSKGRHQP